MNLALVMLLASAQLLWTFTLPDRFTNAIAAIDDGVVVIGGSQTIALDEATGRVRWTAGASAQLAVSGALLWHHPACAKDASGDAFVSTVRIFGSDVMAGCAGGMVVRFSANGAHIIRSRAMIVDRVSDIASAGSCLYNVTGSQSGAILREEDELIDCRTLEPVMRERQEVMFLGTYDHSAVLADECCGLSGAREKPVGLVVVRGHHIQTDEVPLRIGQPILAGSNVCVGDGSSITCYPIDRPASGHLELRGLADWPVPLARGRAGLRLHSDRGTIGELADLTDGRLRVEFSAPAESAPAFAYQPDWTPDVVAVNPFGGKPAWVCLNDGTPTTVPGYVRSERGGVFVSLAPTSRLAGNLSVLQARAWRAPVVCH